ncbi:17008_t:CDS:1, partial [Acaulospora morrowiae]
MSTSQNTQSTQDTATAFEADELKRYRKYWWKTGKLHSKARWEEA